MGFVEIDMNTFPRRKHFEYFRSLAYPYVGITVNVDVTSLVRFCKERGFSFYLAFLHLAALSADGVREFRQRIRNHAIIEYDACSTSHTELLDNGTYCYCTLRHHMPFDEYMVYAENMRRNCREKGSIEEDDEAESMYFISTLPWLNYTSLIQPVAGGDESNPRITWGKFEEDAYGRKQMPVSVLVHHALAGGIHIAKFYENLNAQIQAIAEGNQ